MGNLARNLQLAGHLDEAESLFRKVLDIRRRVSGESAIPTLAIMNNLGLLLLARERPVDAETILRPMAEAMERAVEESHWMRGQAVVNLARSLAGQSKFEEAEVAFLRGYAILASQLPQGHERRSIAATAIADMYERWNRPESASEWRGKEAVTPSPSAP